MGTRLDPFIVDNCSDDEAGGGDNRTTGQAAGSGNNEHLQLNVGYCEGHDAAAHDHPWMRATALPRPSTWMRAAALPALPPRKPRHQKPQPVVVNPGQPLILFDLLGVLTSEAQSRVLQRHVIDVRPELELILKLMPRYQVGVFTCVHQRITYRSINAIHSYLQKVGSSGPEVPGPSTGAAQVLSPVLHHQHCSREPIERHKPPKKGDRPQHPNANTSRRKALAANDLDPSLTLLVDYNPLHAGSEEQGNMVLMPKWDGLAASGTHAWHALIELLLELPSSCTDLRQHVPGINDRLRATHKEALRRRPPSPPPPLSVVLRSAPPHAKQLVALGQRDAAPNREHGRERGREVEAWAVVDDSEDDPAAGSAHQAGKRMRLDGAGDVAGGVPPYLSPHADGSEDDAAADQGFKALQGQGQAGGGRDTPARLAPPAAAAARAEAEAQAEAAAWRPQQPGHAGHKRGRQLPGAQPLYNGPRPGRCVEGAQQHAEEQRRLQRPQPWTQLHYEVEAFSRRALPSAAELALLSRSISKIQGAVSQLWPQAHTHVFGSQASGLALPCSDLDVVILGVVRDLDTPAQGFSHREKVKAVDCLRLVAKAMKSLGICKSKLEVISKAKVPIIKATLVDGSVQLPIDISIGVSNGAAAVSMVRQAVLDLPPVRPLCLVLKALLRESGLNEVFLGGLSSYSLLLMVVAHLQCEGMDASGVLQACSSRLREPRGAAPSPPQQQLAAGPGADAQAGAEEAGPGPGPGPGAAQGSPALSRSEALAQEQMEYLGRLSGSCVEGYDLGLLLMSFLQRFGCIFSYQYEAVSILRGGIMDKPNGWQQKGNMLLGLEDPQEMGRDICSGSYNMRGVRRVFQQALTVLQDSGAHSTHAPRAPAAHAPPAPYLGPAAAAQVQQREAELWAEVQRDGQSSSLPADAPAAAAAAAAAAGAGAAPSSGPQLLDHILDVGAALNRGLTAQQRQQVQPRLRPELAERHCGRQHGGSRVARPPRDGAAKSAKKLRVKQAKIDKQQTKKKAQSRRGGLKLAGLTASAEPWQASPTKMPKKKKMKQQQQQQEQRQQGLKRDGHYARLHAEAEGDGQQGQHKRRQKARGGWVMY